MTLVKAVDDVARLGRRDVIAFDAVGCLGHCEAVDGSPERLAGGHVHLGHEGVLVVPVEVRSNVWPIRVRILGVDEHNVSTYARERQLAAERATDHDHVVLIGERIDFKDLDHGPSATVDAAVVDAVGAELVGVQGVEGVRVRVGVGGERVRGEDHLGHALLGDLVDDGVHAVLRGGVLSKVSAGEAAGRVVDGHLRVGVGGARFALVVCVVAVFVLSVEGQVAHPDGQ